MRVYNAELYHFGIRGMKWGHRKRVQESVEITKVKEKVLQNKTEVKNAQKEYNKNMLSDKSIKR